MILWWCPPWCCWRSCWSCWACPGWTPATTVNIFVVRYQIFFHQSTLSGELSLLCSGMSAFTILLIKQRIEPVKYSLIYSYLTIRQFGKSLGMTHIFISVSYFYLNKCQILKNYFFHTIWAEHRLSQERQMKFQTLR